MLLLTSIRLGWVVYHKSIDPPPCKSGFVDLSQIDMDDRKTIRLDGEWEFYPQKLIEPDQIDQVQGKKQMIHVPGNWDEQLQDANQHVSSGFGTYRLQIKLDKNKNQLYGIRFNEMNSAAHLFINGVLQGQYGRPSTSGDELGDQQGPFIVYFQTDEEIIDLVIHASNDTLPLPYGSGITKSVEFGSLNAIQSLSQQSWTLQAIIAIIFLLHAVYAFTISFLGRGEFENELLYFGIMLTLHGLTILIDDNVLVHLPISAAFYHKLLNVLFISTLFSLLAFIRQLFKIDSKVFSFLKLFYIMLTLGFIFIPFQFIIIFLIGLSVYYLISLIFLFVHTVKSIHAGYPDAIFILLFLASYASNMIWGAMINADFVTISFYPFDFLISIIAIALLLFKKHIRLKKESDQQKEKLQKVDKLRDEFLANTSHELRNPLHGMINIAESIQIEDKELLSSRSQENLDLLINIGKRMNFILNDLNTDNQIKEGVMKLSKTPVNVHASVALVIELLRFMKDGKQVQLISTIDPQFPNVLADETRFIQILFNLLHNALKYTEEGSVMVEASDEGDMAAIYVKDTGVGIQSEQMDKIFDRYERTDADMKMLATGIGIGLSVTKQLVELHGGSISYESSSDGTTFIFTIPLAKEDDFQQYETYPQAEVNPLNLPALMKRESKESDKYSTRNRDNLARILIIDDDSVNVNILSQLLISDYYIETALSGKEALQIIDRKQFDLVISDIMMPHMSGYELTNILRETYTISELPILLITARNSLEDIEAAFAAGANDYLIKPVNARELKARVEALTQLKQSINDSLRMEAAWLQAQIQPHFLFNTLNSIASLARIDSDRMISLLDEFGNYLQKSFSGVIVNSLVSLHNELDLTKSYVYIEKERFGNRLTFDCDIRCDRDVHIPPLSIQPIVENAITHGVLKKPEGGTVHLSIEELQDAIQITIADNGVGMSQGKIDDLLNAHKLGASGVGIKNTNKRLIQRYGQGLEITSLVNEGTTVRFQLPIKEI